jgi:O-antigen/teichoic acid export membrane protein
VANYSSSVRLKVKRLFSDAFVYGVGGVFAKSIGFFLLPIYTRVFNPEDYGDIEMLSVIASYVGLCFAMGMDSAQSMYFFKVRQEGVSAQARIVTAVLQWRLLFGSAIVLLSTLLAPILNTLFFSGRLNWEHFAVAFLSILFSQLMSQSAEVLRLLYKPWAYLGITLSQSMLIAGFVLGLVIILDQGIFGYFLGAVLGSFLTAIFGWYRVREYLDFSKPCWNLWPQLLRFGAPFVPAGVGIYFMSTADRWFIQYYHSSGELGNYAVAAKFVLLLSFAVETFRQAWWPVSLDAMHSEDGPNTFRTIARLYMGCACAGIVLLTFLSPWLVTTLTGPAYHDSWPIVGILAWQSVFYGFFLISSAGIWKAEKTYLNLHIMAGPAILGLILNWILVPAYGAIGAALATSSTYFMWAMASLIVSERLWCIRLLSIRMVLQLATAIVTTIFLLIALENLSLAITSCVAIIVTCILLYSSVDTAQHSSLRGMVRGWRGDRTNE